MILLQSGGALENTGFLVAMFAIFIIFFIVPQFKRARELKKFRSSLQKGDKVLTTGGIMGRVFEIHDTYILMEVEGKTKLKVSKEAVIKDMSDVNLKR